MVYKLTELHFFFVSKIDSLLTTVGLFKMFIKNHEVMY